MVRTKTITSSILLKGKLAITRTTNFREKKAMLMAILGTSNKLASQDYFRLFRMTPGCWAFFNVKVKPQ